MSVPLNVYDSGNFYDIGLLKAEGKEHLVKAERKLYFETRKGT